jgi:hypothetical protein
MNIGFVETDFQKNVKRVSPFLGILLIGAFAYYMFTILNNAMQSLTQVVNTEAPPDVGGTLRLDGSSPVKYGSRVDFKSTVQGVEEGATTFVTVACFQGEKMVYQRSAQQGVTFNIAAQYERDIVWNGETASCSATLMYRKPDADKINLYILDAVSFDTETK